MSFDDFADQLEKLRTDHRHRRLAPRRCVGMSLVESEGNQLVNFGSNDYLGIAADRLSATQSAGEVPGRNPNSGSMASSLVCGWSDRHAALAKSVADLESAESAVIFPSGYAACSGVIATLARQGDLILSDELNHASLIDGCRLSRAECVVYPHRDAEFVDQFLSKSRTDYHRVWIVTDTVFSMDGHTAPLQQLSDLARQHDAEMIVDEAHATGVLGDSGAGLCEHWKLQDRVTIRIGTLSKALGGQGGFVAAPAVIVDFLINHCRPLIFSTALAPPMVESAIKALDLIRSDNTRRSRVRKLSADVRQQLGMEAWEIENEIPIIPIPIGNDKEALRASETMRNAGLYVPAIRPPTVPAGSSRLRVSLSAAHDDHQIARLVNAIQSLPDQ